jgi:hypothetical protein
MQPWPDAWDTETRALRQEAASVKTTRAARDVYRRRDLAEKTDMQFISVPYRKLQDFGKSSGLRFVCHASDD